MEFVSISGRVHDCRDPPWSYGGVNLTIGLKVMKMDTAGSPVKRWFLSTLGVPYFPPTKTRLFKPHEQFNVWKRTRSRTSQSRIQIDGSLTWRETFKSHRLSALLTFQLKREFHANVHRRIKLLLSLICKHSAFFAYGYSKIGEA